MSYVKPDEVKSPKAHWYLFEVVVDKGPGDCAYALGEWDGERRIGFRWNGSKDNPLGNPQSRGLSTWTMLDPAMHKLVVNGMFPAEKRPMAYGFLGIKG